MTRRVFVWAWLLFAATLVCPFLWMMLDQMFGLSWNYDLGILFILSQYLIRLSPVMFGIAVTLHTIKNGQYRRLAIGLGVFHAAYGVAPMLISIFTNGGQSLSSYGFVNTYPLWWVSGLELSLLLILGLRVLTCWAPSVWSRGLRILALAVLGVAFILVVYSELFMLIMEQRYVDPSVDRGLPIMFIVFGAALSGVSILWSGTERAMGKRWRKIESTLDKRIPVRVECPKCGEGVEVASGVRKRCTKCGLGIEVRLDEPRCACGYLLYDLEGELCPECGVKIPDELRWKETSPHPPLGDRESSPGSERD